MDRPILFSAPMVRAILDDKKTQTRRVVKPRRYEGCSNECVPDYEHARPDPGLGAGGYLHVPCQHGASQRERCVHQIGDRLWVKETHAFIEGGEYDPLNGDYHDVFSVGGPVRPGQFRLAYRADDAWQDECNSAGIAWRPSIHMPRWASRLTLEVTGVRVERLQDISDDDARAEGVENRGAFAELWDSINGAGSWEANPWVWVVEFKRVEEVMRCVSCGCSTPEPWEALCDRCDGAPDHTPCPQCKAPVADWDGFGVLHHAPCGYCQHASVVDGVCGFCGKRVP